MRTYSAETSVDRHTKIEYLKGKRLEMLDAIKRNEKFECLFKDNEILKGGEKMMKELRDWHMGQPCTICKESWFNQSKHPDATECDRCKREKPKENEVYTFSEDNDMIPGPIPDVLKILNDIEEASIKLIKPFLHIFRRKGGSVGFKGNCISFPQDIPEFSKTLPWHVQDLPILIIQSKNDTKERGFYANANCIQDALKWLQENHPDY